MKLVTMVLAAGVLFLGLAAARAGAQPQAEPLQRPGVEPRQAEQVRQWALAHGWAEAQVPGTADPATLDAATAPNGVCVFAPDRDNLGPHQQIPSKADLGRPFAALAFPGEFEGLPLAIHALRDLDRVTVEVSDLTSAAGGKINAADVEIRDVIYAPFSLRNRSAMENKFRLWPLWMVPHKPDALKANDGRVVWLTVHCPPGLPAGEYKGVITVRVEPGKVAQMRDLRLDVQPFALAGSMCDWCPVMAGNGFDLEVYRQLVEHHMTGMSWWWGNWGLTVTREGEGPTARASFDPAPMDMLNAVTRQAGMRGPWILMFGNQTSGHLERRIAGLYPDRPQLNPPLFDVKLIPCPPMPTREGRGPSTRPAAAARVATTAPAGVYVRSEPALAVADLNDKEMDRRYVEVLQSLAKRAKDQGYPQIIVMPYDEPTRRLKDWNARYCDLIHKFVPELKILNNPQGSVRSAQLWMPYSDYMECEGGGSEEEMAAYEETLKAGKLPFGYTRLWSNITTGQARFDLGLRFARQQAKIIYFWSMNFGDMDAATPFNDLFERDSGFRHRFAWPPVKPGDKWVETVVWEAQREGAKDYLLVLMVEATLRELANAKPAVVAEVRKDFDAFKADVSVNSKDLDQRRAKLVGWYRSLTGK